ncbi:hypothetical protein ILUMI_13914 [Ignelater luminosus]|uniref:Uncharacterized protein n=1 Tax=Ignelater luminosus TaxID=2038154 RepID=A0A8K0CVU0_IGNLU|nr:hypothetical protein ILUMI_13914 [Ignelater luminosus]
MSSIRELDFYGNNLTYLHENAFVGLKGLKYLDLGHNKLVLVEGITFKPLQSLETLDLSYNNIKAVTPYLLEHTNVSELYLSGNEFEFFRSGHILESNSLTVLTLQLCKLKILDENLFEMLPNLKYLDISYNQLETIPENLLKPLRQLEQLDISNNQIANLNMNMFPLPSKLEVILCDKNPSDLKVECENIIEQLLIVTETTLLHAETNTNPIFTEKQRKRHLVENEVTESGQTNTLRNLLIPKVTTAKPKLKSITTIVPQKGIVKIEQIASVKPYHDTIKQPLERRELSSGIKEKENELEDYLYVGLYGLSSIIVILFIIFFIEIFFLLRIGRSHKLEPRDFA